MLEAKAIIGTYLDHSDFPYHTHVKFDLEKVLPVYDRDFETFIGFLVGSNLIQNYEINEKGEIVFLDNLMAKYTNRWQSKIHDIYELGYSMEEIILKVSVI